MDSRKLIDELLYYQFYLSKAIAQIFINDKICDFYDNNKEKCNLYYNSLCQISSALVLSQRMIFCNIFIEDKDSKQIHRLLNKIKSNKIVPQNEVDLEIKAIADSLLEEISQQSNNIDKLKQYRNNVLAHFNTRFFDNDWRASFPIDNGCDFIAIKNLASKVFDGCSQILRLLKTPPIDSKTMTPTDFNLLIKKISQ